MTKKKPKPITTPAKRTSAQSRKAYPMVIEGAKSQLIPAGYKQLLQDIKERIRSAQIKAALAVNAELISLYWGIGHAIHNQQQKEGWGAKTIEKLSRDIKDTFPDMKGFSLSNLKYMVQFAKEYPNFQISQQLVGQIPWGHNILLMQSLSSLEERLWYASQAIENGWSRNVLWHWIDSGLYHRQGKAITNFKAALPDPQSDLAQQTLKDPYSFDFLELRQRHDEKELEDALLEQIPKVLLELGQGFAFVGRQYKLDVDGDIHYIDLLFYHTKLHCYVIVELKAGAFSPRDAGQINFYLNAVDDMLRSPEDNPSIGLLLCKGKKGLKAEYALRGIQKPIGVATYKTKLLERLPKALKGSLPTIEEIEAELQDKP